MKKACLDCQYLSTYGGSSTGGFVECSRHPKQYVSNAFEHVRSYVCDNFAPKFISDREPRILEGLQCAQREGNPSLRAAIERWFAGPPNDVTVSSGRGLPMVSVADGNLETFEFDKGMKSYSGSNHLFADVFGGFRVKWPILFFLSETNAPGVSVKTLGKSSVSVLYLGAPYSLAEVVGALSHVLSLQGLKLVRPWFLRHLRTMGIEPTDPSFSSFVALSPEFEQFLSDRRNSLIGFHAVISASRNHVDEQAVAEALGLKISDYVVLRCDASKSFHILHRSSDIRDFSGPFDLHHRLRDLHILAVLASPHRYDSLWKQMPENTFSDTRTVLVFVDQDDLDWAMGLPAFRGFNQQTVPVNHLALE